MSEDALKVAEIAAEIWRLKYLKAKEEKDEAVRAEREACIQILVNELDFHKRYNSSSDTIRMVSHCLELMTLRREDWFRTQTDSLATIQARGNSHEQG